MIQGRARKQKKERGGRVEETQGRKTRVEEKEREKEEEKERADTVTVAKMRYNIEWGKRREEEQ